MTKKTKITLSIILAIVVIFILGLWFMFNQEVSSIRHNTQKAEKLMGIKLPSNYIPIIVSTKTSKKNKEGDKESIVLLYNPKGKTILWVSGPKIEKKLQKEAIIDNFRQFIQSSEEHSLIKNNIDIIPEGTLRLRNKEFEKYRFNLYTNGYESSGMATFLDYPDKTVLFIYLSSFKKYNIQEATNILEKMKLPE